MKNIRRLHAATALAAGLALAASLYGYPRIATVLLVIVVVALVLSLEALRVLAAQPEKHP